jgi:hypothetical protein
MTDPVANEVAQTVQETGRLFGSAGIDGLVLWALLIGSLLLFAGLMFSLWLNSRERARAETAIMQQGERHAEQVKGFTDAALATAEAVKDLATAVSSSASADMTFKQVMANQIVDCEGRMRTLEAQRRDQP